MWYVFNSSTQEAGADRSLWVQSQPGLHSKCQNSHGNIDPDSTKQTNYFSVRLENFVYSKYTTVHGTKMNTCILTCIQAKVFQAAVIGATWHASMCSAKYALCIHRSKLQGRCWCNIGNCCQTTQIHCVSGFKLVFFWAGVSCKVGLELTMQSKMTLNFWFSCFSLPSSGLPGKYHSALFYAVVGIKARALCRIGKHSTNGDTSLDPGFEFWQLYVQKRLAVAKFSSRAHIGSRLTV